MIQLQEVVPIGEGAWSLGFKLTCMIAGVGQSVFVKMEKKLEQQGQSSCRRMELIRSSASRPGIVETFGVFGWSTENGLLPLQPPTISPEVLEGLEVIFSVQRLVDHTEFAPLLSILAKFGLETIQTSDPIGETEYSGEKLISTYLLVTRKMIEMHSTPTPLMSEEQKRNAYHAGVEYVLNSSERMRGLAASMPDFSKGAISEERVSALVAAMQALAKKYQVSAPERVTYIHGDYWGANIFSQKQGDPVRVEVIDPISALFGEPANDVTFALADLAFLDINRSNGAELSGNFALLADQFVDEYQRESSDWEIRNFMALFFAYKAFVSALFDAGDNQYQRLQLFNVACGVAELALRDENFTFSFNQIAEYARVGSQISAGVS